MLNQSVVIIFNVRHRLGGPAAFLVAEGVSAQDLIDMAIAAWQGTDAMLQNILKDQLDALNNNDAVVFVPADPCEVIFD